MSEQALDLRRSLRTVRRHKLVVGIFTALGLFAGAGYAVHSPPMVTSNALVLLSTTSRTIATQVVIAGSDPVLAGASRLVSPAMSPQALQSHVHAKSITPNILSISAQGKTADQAESTANAIAHSYIAYVRSAKGAGAAVQARLLESATSAARSSFPIHLLVMGGLGALLGFLIGAIVVLAIGRKDRRLRQRDEIADSIGVPVLTSVSVGRPPSDAAGWTKLFEDYEPGPVDAWRLRKALHQLGFAGVSLTELSAGSGSSLTVLSLSSDRKALALGPQLAAFAAFLGIPTVLIVGPLQGADAMATLRAACAVPPEPSRRSRNLRVTVSDQDEAPDRLRLPGAGLAIVVAAVDGQAPRVADTMRTTATVLGVSAGAATAEQLARVAASAADEDRDLAGILVADPDPADHTTGRVPHLARPANRRMPRRVADMPAETRR